MVKSSLCLLAVVMLCTPVLAFSQDSSSIVTLPADNITSTSARLRASVTTDGSGTNVGFHLFLERDISSQGDPPDQIISGQAGTIEFTSTVNGLVPNTRYLYWAGSIFDRGEAVVFETADGPRGERLVIPFNLWDTHNLVRTLHFGVDTYGSKCIDFSLGEMEQPPPPPGVIFAEAQFKGDCLGNGTFVNLHKYTSTAQVDTYRVAFLADPASYPVSLAWPKLDSLYSGPVVLRIGSESIDMKLINRYDIADDAFTIFRIFATGPRTGNNPTHVLTKWVNEWGYSWRRLSTLVFPSSDTTTVWFEWGTTLALGNSTTPRAVFCRAPILVYADTLFGNQSTSEVYYRGVTQDVKGKNFGAIQHFDPQISSDVPVIPSVPGKFFMEQNYPNPFNPTTTISYSLPEREHVKVSVFNMLGEVVEVLVDGVQAPGVQSVAFNATGLPSGVYVCKITAGKLNDAKKLLLIK